MKINKLEYEIITGQQLVNTVRELCDKVKNRLWIAVPYIGFWEDVQRIIGTKWQTDSNVDVRLLTDIDNKEYIKYDTIKEFKERGEIRTLSGLHAKMYIIDNKVIITSANLTKSAFSERDEIGVLLDSKKCEDIFLLWWKKSEEITSRQILSLKFKKIKKEEPSQKKEIRKRWTPKWKLPESLTIKFFKDYRDYKKEYNNFKKISEKYLKKIWKNEMPIYQQIDSFLNYLYHEHPNTPSRKYNKKRAPNLSENKRIKRLKKYLPEYKRWLSKRKKEEKDWRLKSIRETKRLLSPKKIDKLTWKDVEKVLNFINAMNSVPIAKENFLKSKRNSLSKIKKEWKNLLHNNDKDPIERMEECKRRLFGFGRSSIQELIALYYPEKYPIINSNSVCGLRFFGYDIKAYYK